MKLGQVLKRNGSTFKVYKIDNQGRCFAEDGFENIICVPNLTIIK